MGTVSVSTTQYIGDCTTWRVATAAESWPATFAGRELDDHPGRLDLETRVVTRSAAGVSSDMWGDGVMGLMVYHLNTNLSGTITQSHEHLPKIEGLWSGYPWTYVDTMETIHLWEPMNDAADGRVDGVPENWVSR